MAKIDKSLYTKQEWIAIRNQRRLQKQLQKQTQEQRDVHRISRLLNTILLAHSDLLS